MLRVPRKHSARSRQACRANETSIVDGRSLHGTCSTQLQGGFPASVSRLLQMLRVSLKLISGAFCKHLACFSYTMTHLSQREDCAPEVTQCRLSARREAGRGNVPACFLLLFFSIVSFLPDKPEDFLRWRFAGNQEESRCTCRAIRTCET